MNKQITDLVEQCAKAYQICREYMNPQSLSLIERNHRQKITDECVEKNADFVKHLQRYEELITEVKK